MTSNFLTAISWWFQTAWRFLTSVYLPGTNVTPAAMLLFAAAAVIGIKFIRRLLDTGNDNE